MTLVRRVADRVLVDRAVYAYIKRISLSTIRRHHTPVACDVSTRAVLYDGIPDDTDRES